MSALVLKDQVLSADSTVSGMRWALEGALKSTCLFKGPVTADYIVQTGNMQAYICTGIYIYTPVNVYRAMRHVEKSIDCKGDAGSNRTESLELAGAGIRDGHTLTAVSCPATRLP